MQGAAEADRNRRLAKIAYLLLCHGNAERVLEQARILTSKDDYVVIHADASASPAFHAALRTGLKDNDAARLAQPIKCGWGEWSLVDATLRMIKEAYDSFADATHFFLISGDCLPTKPAHYIHAQLDADNQDHIEHADFLEGNWIKTGMHEDRLIYRHWFNERSQRKLFYGSLAIQRKLGLKRKTPDGMRIRIGSQWWVLRRDTIEKILSFLKKRPEVTRFFRTTWIPDETFFQTLTMHLVPREEVNPLPPTYLMFSDYGMPVTFYADHYDLLRTQDRFFARKISNHDDTLREKLGALYASDQAISGTTGSGRVLYDYVRKRGRSGRRFGVRAWESGSRLGPRKKLNLIVCKKWHVARRFAAALRNEAGAHAFGYVFDEDQADLPAMGNLEGSRDKRNRHRRAFLKVLYDELDTETVSICLDPAQLDAIRDFDGDGCQLSLLEIVCPIDEAWLEAHAERIGLGSRAEAGDLHRNLLTTLKINIDDERTAIEALGLGRHRVIGQFDTAGSMARPIAETIGLPIDTAGRVAQAARVED